MSIRDFDKLKLAMIVCLKLSLILGNDQLPRKLLLTFKVVKSACHKNNNFATFTKILSKSLNTMQVRVNSSHNVDLQLL